MIPEDLIPIVKEWLSYDYDPQTREAVQWLVDNGSEGLREAFGDRLSFGTGGLRSLMGVGTNRMNIYTVGAATQGLVNYLHEYYRDSRELRVAIAYDSRNQSTLFAQTAADTLAANNVRVYLFDAPRPTPQLSYTVRALRCHAGIVITASHNPKEYNGYKVYWANGAQVVAPHDEGIMRAMNEITRHTQVKKNGDKGLIVNLAKEADEAYLNSLVANDLQSEGIEGRGQLKIVYSPIHGAGAQLVPLLFKRLGFTDFQVVDRQKQFDGNFRTVTSPNPENEEAMALSVELAEEVGADLVMANDPDADRVGAYARDRQGKLHRLDGNQVALLFAEYILSGLKQKKRLSRKSYIVRTLVTTPLLDRVANHWGVASYVTLTGFKYIAALMETLAPTKQFVMAAEESLGYLAGDWVRDKDGVQACALLALVAADAKAEGLTLIDRLVAIYTQYGFMHSAQKSVTMQGLEGQKEIAAIMQGLRAKPPTQIAGEKVVKTLDLLEVKPQNRPTEECNQVIHHASNLLQYTTEKGSLITIRPSGTEPKIKYYATVESPFQSFEETMQSAQAHLAGILDAIAP